MQIWSKNVKRVTFEIETNSVIIGTYNQSVMFLTCRIFSLVFTQKEQHRI